MYLSMEKGICVYGDVEVEDLGFSLFLWWLDRMRYSAFNILDPEGSCNLTLRCLQ